jgi:serine/threonine-protein kinase
MSASGEDTRVAALLVEYLASGRDAEAGGRETFFAEHPEEAAALREALEGVDLLHRAAREMRGEAGEGDDSVLSRMDPRIDSHVLLREAGPEGPPVRIAAERGREGRYEILGEIARGGVGAVLRGRDVDLGRDVALKVLRDEYSSNPQMVQRFVEEAQIGGQLQHPGIVPVYEMGLGQGRRPFFTMKLVKGRTLAALLADRRDAAVDRRRLLSIFEAVCHTMAYAHARGVIHRDLKPANVMVGAFGEVLVVDWGMAKVVPHGGVADEKGAARAERSVVATVRSGPAGSHSALGEVMGTPRYMPPEQARGDVEHLDERADVFALGAILCEILTGRPPYLGSEADVLALAARGDLGEGYARLRGSGAPEDLIALALSCLAVEPAARPREAGAVAEALGRHLTAVEERARVAQIEAAEAAVRESQARVIALQERRRRRLTAALAGSVVAAVLLGGGGVWWAAEGRRERRQEAEGTVSRAIEEATVLGARAEATADLASHRESLAAARAAASLAASDQVGEELRGRARSVLERIAAAESAARAAAKQERRDREMVDRLTEAQLGFSSSDPVEQDRKFREAFAAYDLDVDTMPVAEAVRRARASRIASHIVNGLGAWGHAKWRLRAPGGKLDEVRRGVAAGTVQGRWLEGRQTATDFKALLDDISWETVETADVMGFVTMLGQVDPDRASALAAELKRRRPGDFWANLLCAERSRARNATDDAVRHFSAAVALRPDLAHVHHGLGEALLEKGDFEAAASSLREALRREPGFAAARNDLGVALLSRGDVDGARVELEQATRDEPELWEAHKNLGHTLLLRGLAVEAIPPLEAALRLRPTEGGTSVLLAYAQDVAKDPTQAIQALREAALRGPEDAATQASLGRALYVLGDYTGAAASLQRAVDLDPRTAVVHSRLGQALAGLGRFEEAAAAMARAVELDPEDTATGENLGTLLWTLGDLEGAKARYRETVRRRPELASAHARLGSLCFFTGEREAGTASLREALRLRPDLGAQVRWANALGFWLGDWDGAVEFLLPLVERERVPGTLHEQLAAVHARCGRLREALVALRPVAEGGSETAQRTLETLERRIALEASLPDVIRGTLVPATAGERRDYADLAYMQRRYVAAARLYCAEDWPEERDDTDPDLLAVAACVAIFAGCGEGMDADSADEATRAAFRAKGVLWLRRGLAAWERRFSREPFGLLGRTVNLVCIHDLSGIREESRLAALPPEERAECRALWSDVRGLARRARRAWALETLPKPMPVPP